MLASVRWWEVSCNECSWVPLAGQCIHGAKCQWLLTASSLDHCSPPLRSTKDKRSEPPAAPHEGAAVAHGQWPADLRISGQTRTLCFMVYLPELVLSPNWAKDEPCVQTQPCSFPLSFLACFLHSITHLFLGKSSPSIPMSGSASRELNRRHVRWWERVQWAKRVGKHCMLLNPLGSFL